MSKTLQSIRDHVPQKLTLKWIGVTKCAALLGLFVLPAGCGFNVGLGSIDLKTRTRAFIPSGQFREVIVNVQDEERRFQTFARVGSQLQMRTIDFDGKVLGQQTIPLLTTGYCARNTYAVSPDGARIVYFHPASHGLRLYDTATRTDSRLMDRVASTGIEIAKMYFVSPHEMVLLLLDDDALGRHSNMVIRFDIEAGVTKTVVEPTDCFPGHDTALSKSKRYLTYWEGREKHSIYGPIRILDLMTSRIVGTIKCPGDVLLSKPCVSPNDQTVACVIGNEIVVAPLTGDPIRVVKRLPAKALCCYLAFRDDTTLLYLASGGLIPAGLRSLDIVTGKDTACIREVFNGSIYVVEKGSRLLCELGY